MIRSLVALSLTMVLACDSLAAPKLLEKPDFPIYLPTTEGMTLVYTLSSPDGSSTQSDRVKTVEMKEKSLTVTIERSNSHEMKSILRYQMTEEGLYRLKGDGSKTHRKIQLPFKPDETWDFIVDPDVKYTFTAKGKVKIKVPAGTFDTVCMETKLPETLRENFILRTWYAHGIGIVKEERVVDGKVTEVKELSSITTAK